LDGAKLDADLAFPGRIKQALNQWRVGFPVTTIDDKEVTIWIADLRTRLGRGEAR